MTINKALNGEELTISLAGRLDTITAPQAETEIKENLQGITSLIVDMKDLEYVSSAGLRVLLSVHKSISGQGKMVVKNVNEIVMEVFEVTGFVDVLNIEA